MSAGWFASSIPSFETDKTGPQWPVFFWDIKQKKSPAEGRGRNQVEHIQESVLVSTLKRCSALLTQLEHRSVESFLATKQVGLSTGTVPVGRFTGGKG